MHDRAGLYFWDNGSQLVLFLSGRVTANEAYQFFAHLQPWMAAHPTGSLILDLDGTSYIDSTVIGTLIRLQKSQRRNGGSFALCNLSEAVEEIIRKTKLLKYFAIISDDALRDLEHVVFERLPERDREPLESRFVLDAHNDICEAVPELRPQFEQLISMLQGTQSRRNTSN